MFTVSFLFHKEKTFMSLVLLICQIRKTRGAKLAAILKVISSKLLKGKKSKKQNSQEKKPIETEC